MNLMTKLMKKIPFKEIFLVICVAGIAVLIIYGAAVGAVQASEKAIQILENQGYTNVELIGSAPFAGGEDDMYKFHFRAVNSNNREIEGVVTGDDFKGWTIRLF